MPNLDIQIFKTAYQNIVQTYCNGLLLMKANAIAESQALRKSGSSFQTRKFLLDKLRWIETKQVEVKKSPMPAINELVDDELLNVLFLNVHPTVQEIEASITRQIKNFYITI